jgi:DUF4097 and DUF4098 domain-containing protein YvlB
MQKTFEVTGPVGLDVRLAAGQIEVEPALDGRVEVELTADDDESQRLIDEARVELGERHGRPELVVDVPQRRGGFGLSLFGRGDGIWCRIRCPHDSALSARTKSADVSARGTLGALNVMTASGDVVVDRVSGGANVKSASGDFSAREIGSGVSVQTASGDVSIETARGPVNAATASGDV